MKTRNYHHGTPRDPETLQNQPSNLRNVWLTNAWRMWRRNFIVSTQLAVFHMKSMLRTDPGGGEVPDVSSFCTWCKTCGHAGVAYVSIYIYIFFYVCIIIMYTRLFLGPCLVCVVIVVWYRSIWRRGGNLTWYWKKGGLIGQALMHYSCSLFLYCLDILRAWSSECGDATSMNITCPNYGHN